VRLWIDTDVGDNPDDAVALVVARAHPGVELVGVSTTGGDHQRRVALAASLVDAPVVAGSEPDVLARRVADGDLDAMLAIGPLTNVARLLVLGASLPPLTVMGGALAPVPHRGTVYGIEHNFGADPAAASVVIAATDALVVPLDVTASMRVDERELQQLLDAAPVLASEIEVWRARAGLPLVLHDPLALLACTGEPVVDTAVRALAVDPGTGEVRVDGDGREHAVAVGADVHAAVDRLLALLR
jgi:inosine-uridine nucleoside N-ribohydrolase